MKDKILNCKDLSTSISSQKNGIKTLYFDCYYGISGDMALGALLDCGADLKSLQEILSGLNLKGWSLNAEVINRGGIAGTRALVELLQVDASKRHLEDILAILEQSSLPDQVKLQSQSVFKELAAAEAAVHGISVDEVHFHEVGAVDSIIDIVGTCSALYLLAVDRIICSPLPASRGEISCAHGILPLPAPATLELLARHQVPLESRDKGYELVTPTGAALVTVLAESFAPIPDFCLSAVGYGAGSTDPGYANYLRALIGYNAPLDNTCEEKMAVIETNIDDLNPEIYGYLMEKLFNAGAFDVYYTPVQMKKNRPGVHLTILSPPEKIKTLQDLVFLETSSFGCRLTMAQKIKLTRKYETINTEWGKIKIKYIPDPGGGKLVHYAPEYEDCRTVAAQSGLPLKEVYRLVEQLFRNRFISSG